MKDDVPAGMRAIILNAFPDLDRSTFTPMTTGWDSLAIDVDDRLIFKFPRDAHAEKALSVDASLLAVIRPAVTMTVPDLHIHNGPPLFSVHEKIKGAYLLTEDYEVLPASVRDRLAADIARFYAELHRLPRDRMATVGAEPITPWQTPAAMRARALPALPSELRHNAQAVIAAFEDLPPDPLGTTYGFFDGHGWNMAFDTAGQRLNGIYDFADSGFGPRHQEFIYTNLISADLTERVIAAYEHLTDCILERERIETLTGAHRLSELAELADDSTHAPDVTSFAVRWLGRAHHRG
jgi:aminoglycoside phosphotransferase (APT) family kinase protein